MKHHSETIYERTCEPTLTKKAFFNTTKIGPPQFSFNCILDSKLSPWPPSSECRVMSSLKQFERLHLRELYRQSCLPEKSRGDKAERTKPPADVLFTTKPTVAWRQRRLPPSWGKKRPRPQGVSSPKSPLERHLVTRSAARWGVDEARFRPRRKGHPASTERFFYAALDASATTTGNSIQGHPERPEVSSVLCEQLDAEVGDVKYRRKQPATCCQKLESSKGTKERPQLRNLSSAEMGKWEEEDSTTDKLAKIRCYNQNAT